MKRIALTLSAGTLLAGVAWFFFGADTTITNHPPKNNIIVAFGDSLVFGTGATAGNDFVSLLAKDIGRPILNLGVPGDTTADGMRRLPQVLAEDPGMVILLLGGNDYLKKIPQEETFANLTHIIETLHAKGAVVVLLGVQGGILKDTYRDRFAALAEDTGAIYVPDVLRGLVGNMTYMSDAIHPNDAGYARIAERIAEVLREY